VRCGGKEATVSGGKQPPSTVTCTDNRFYAAPHNGPTVTLRA
jgi:hypothetical protein